MTRMADILLRMALCLIALASVVFAALPVMRHAAGIVATENVSGALPVGRPIPEPVDLSPLLATFPFGRAVQVDTGNATAGRETPNFVLRGIFSAEGAASTALLGVDGETGLYRQSDEVTAAYVLSRVAADHVVLTGAGQTITLGFDAQNVLGADGQVDKPASTPADLVARLGSGLVVPARAEKPKDPETTSEYIDYWRKRIRKNPKAVLDEIGLTPSDNGYVIAERHDVGVRLAGLKAGDLVRSVNGQSVGDPEDDRRFYDRVAASGQARIEVERNGRLLTFSFPLR